MPAGDCPETASKNLSCSQHAVRPRRQPPEEVEGHGRELVPEPRMSQDIESAEEGHDLERGDIKDDGRD